MNVVLAAEGSSGTATASSHEFKSGDADVVVASPADSIYVSLDGGAAKQVTLADGTYQAANNGDGSANDIVKAMNDALTTAFGASAPTASVDAGGNLVLTSGTAGAASSVVVTDDPANPGLLTQLFGAGGATSASGTDGYTADALASAIQSQANAQLQGTGAGVTVTSTGGVIKIANNALGAGSDHSFAAMTGNATTAGQWANGLFGMNAGTNRTGDDLVSAINNELQANSTLSAAGLTASWNDTTNDITFSGTSAFRMNSGAAPAEGTTVGTTDLTDGADFSASPMTLQISTDGGSAVTVNLTQHYSSASAIATDIQSQLAAAGSNAVVSTTSLNGKTYLELQAKTTGTGGSVQVLSGGTANATLRLTDNAVHANSAQVNIGFGVSGSTNTGSLGLASANSALNVVDASGTSQTGAISFQALTNAGAKTQSLTISANNTGGAMQSMTITLAATGAGTPALANDGSGDSIDNAVKYINSQLQQSNNPTLQQIVAVKQVANGNEEINFISALPGFEVGIGTANNNEGLNAGVANAAMGVETGTASTISISTQSGAEAAVAAVANALTTLGKAQGAIGSSENQLTYAINNANSEITSFSAAESRIRDTDVAAEAANLSKAQVLQQAAIAAMAQANSAPQSVLKLLG